MPENREAAEALVKAYDARGRGVMGEPGLFRRLVLCRLGTCPFREGSDDTHLWGECTICGKRAGTISREAVRRYMEAEERARYGYVLSDRAALAPVPSDDTAQEG